jgi:hypothetical protein
VIKITLKKGWSIFILALPKKNPAPALGVKTTFIAPNLSTFI